MSVNVENDTDMLTVRQSIQKALTGLGYDVIGAGYDFQIDAMDVTFVVNGATFNLQLTREQESF